MKIHTTCSTAAGGPAAEPHGEPPGAVDGTAVDGTTDEDEAGGVGRDLGADVGPVPAAPGLVLLCVPAHAAATWTTTATTTTKVPTTHGDPCAP
jgi:hypothetical protein